MNFINVSKASTPELVAYFNAHSGKPPVKRFSDRKAAEKRVAALIEAAPIAAKIAHAVRPKEAATNRKQASAPAADRGKAIAASWKNKQVAAARATRHAVRVTDPKGGQGTYRSVRDAFVQLGLPLGRHIKFRGALKAAGKAEIDGFKFRLLAD